MPLPELRLRRNARARVLQGHPWVFAGEIERLPETHPPGAPADLLDASGRFVARGTLNVASVLAFRVLTRDPAEPIDAAFLERRLKAALDFRARTLPGLEALRLVSGEADGLPGLVVDRYGAHLVLQATTAGMDRLAGEAAGLLERLLSPVSILTRHDIPVRAREGLPLDVIQLKGKTPDRLSVRLDGLELAFDPWRGQKTGLYLDQRAHYPFLAGRCEGRRVLDAFCYVGGWSLAAARAGAADVLGIDASGPALAFARANAAAAGFGAVRFEEGNVFDVLRGAYDRRERYGGVVLDPPPFVKTKEDLAGGMRAYKELNLRALSVLEPGGWLVTASCSQRVSPDAYEACLREAAADAGRSVRVLGAFTQPPDHPILLEVPETAYLKGLFLEVLA